MKINNIKINSYGKLKNKDINFEDGINVIKGDNESGKSTLLNYITDIFYGISKTKDGKEMSDFDKYKPWNSDEFSGRIKYTLDNGKQYEVFRDFKSKNPRIYNEKLEDISDQFDIDKKDGNKFFNEQTQVDKLMYLSTVVSMQQAVKLDQKNQNMLVQKIANIASSGEENISYKKASEKLQNRIKDEIGTNKTSQKPINILQNRIVELNNEIEKIKVYEDRKFQIDIEKNEIKEQIKNEKIEYELYNKLKNINNEAESEKQKINIISNSKRENEEQLKELYNQIDGLKIKQQELSDEKERLKRDIENVSKSTNSNQNVEKNTKKFAKNLLIILVLISLIIVNIFTMNNSVLTGILGASIVGYFCLLIIKKSRKNKNIRENIKKQLQKSILDTNRKLEELEILQSDIIKDIANIDGKINILEETNNKFSEQEKDINTKIENEINLKIRSLINEFNGSINDYQFEISHGKDISSKIDNISENISRLNNLFNKLEVEENIVLPKLEQLVILKEQRDLHQEELIELNKKAEIINMTIGFLQSAYEEMKTTVTPIFTKKLSESISKISNNKYSKVTINDEKGMIVENENGEYIDLARLSLGTIDELYLSLRLSMIDELSEEGMPILLDETFAFFDNKRMKASFEYLNDNIEKHQVIMFTCGNREIDILDKMDYKYNLIEL